MNLAVAMIPTLLAAAGAVADLPGAEATGWLGNAAVLWWFHQRLGRIEERLDKRKDGR